jgi:hypothetical protein
MAYGCDGRPAAMAPSFAAFAGRLARFRIDEMHRSEARCDLRSSMPPFIFRCPNTDFRVQGFAADDGESEPTTSSWASPALRAGGRKQLHGACGPCRFGICLARPRPRDEWRSRLKAARYPGPINTTAGLAELPILPRGADRRVRLAAPRTGAHNRTSRRCTHDGADDGIGRIQHLRRRAGGF